MKNIIEYKECPLCHSGHFNEIITVPDFSVSKEEFDIKECNKCKLWLTNAIPDFNGIGDYYKSDEYISHTNKGNSLINILYKFVRSFTLKSKIDLIKKFKGKTLLDIGCGAGLFLEEALKNGYDIYGVETEIERTTQHPEVKKKVVNSIEQLSSTYDIITMWHVLEHMHDLDKSFQTIVNKINPSGHIVVAVPNSNSWDSKHYKQHWAAWDVPRHLYHFQKEQIEYLFNKYNITLEKILPMKMDSFYVSMLSEKYKGNTLPKQLVKGFINGLRSNLNARKINYSSQIFIGQKNEI